MHLGDPDYFHHVAFGGPKMAPRKYQLLYMKALEAIVGARQARQVPPSVPICFIAARQSGKNESNARVEARLLSIYGQSPEPLEIVKAAPTWRPQCLISKERLQRVMRTPLFTELIKPQWKEGYQCHVGNASLKLVSADPKSHSVGLTASLLLSADEAQDITQEKWDIDFVPMTLNTGAPVVMSGTSWHTDSLLERQRHRAQDFQSKHGFRCLYVFPWDLIAEEHEDYGLQVQAIRNLYGDDHILYLTQFCCLPIEAAGMLLSSTDVDNLVGDHHRLSAPLDGRVYVAGVDFAAHREQTAEEMLRNPQKAKKSDSTVVTIGELMFKIDSFTGRKIPIVRVVDHLWVDEKDPHAATDQISDYVFNRWRCVRAVLDKNGVGSYPSEIIRARYPAACNALHLSGPIKSRLGYDLQGAAKTGRLKMYRCDESREWHECMKQLRHCRRHDIKANSVMEWSAPHSKVDGQDIHDDFVLSMAYCFEAAQEHLSHYSSSQEFAQRGPLWSFDCHE